MKPKENEIIESLGATGLGQVLDEFFIDTLENIIYKLNYMFPAGAGESNLTLAKEIRELIQYYDILGSRLNGDSDNNFEYIYLVDEAYADNGENGEIVYRAHGIDCNENDFLITWELSKDCKEHTESWEAGTFGTYCPKCQSYDCYFMHDESQNCNWDSPIKIEIL